MENQEELISLKDAAAMLKIEPATLRKYAQNGIIKGTKLGGRWYFNEETIKARRTTPHAVNKSKIEPRNSVDLRKHWDILNGILSSLLGSLKDANEIETEKHTPFRDIVLTDGQQEGKAYVDDKHRRLLLEHLKNEIPELQGFDNWLDMTATDLTNELLDKLTVINVRGTFKGECEGCP